MSSLRHNSYTNILLFQISSGADWLGHTFGYRAWKIWTVVVRGQFTGNTDGSAKLAAWYFLGK